MKLQQLALVLLATFLIIISACNKKNPFKEKECEMEDQVCDSALLMLENRTDETIHFNRGDYDSSFPYNRTIKPGQTITYKTGNVEVHFGPDCDVRSSSTNGQTIGTEWMYYSIKMDRCHKHAYFFKDKNDNIDLHIE